MNPRSDQNGDEKRPFLSVACPVYNEEANVEELCAEITRALAGHHFEVIFVDDGSRDATLAKLEALAQKDERIRVVQLRMNCGQTAALSAGFDVARGDVVVPMDGDLQNDPADIPKLLERIDEGYDVVSGWRKPRHDPFLTKKLPSFFANWLIRKVTGVNIHDYGCTLKAYRREILRDIRLYGEMHRFLPALAAWVGARVCEVPVHHRARKFGKSKYGLGRIFKVMMDLITVKFFMNFHTKPSYVFGAIGAFLFSLGMIAFCIVAFRVLILERREATPMVFMMVTFFLAAIQCVLMGLLAEVLVRVQFETQKKPIYFVKRLIGFKRPDLTDEAQPGAQNAGADSTSERPEPPGDG